MSSATEAELAALYIMAREAVYIRIILKEMGHKQPPTPIKTDSAMAEAVINGKNPTQTNQSNGHALSDSIGAQARRTTRTTGQNITYTYQAITSTCEKNF